MFHHRHINKFIILLMGIVLFVSPILPMSSQANEKDNQAENAQEQEMNNEKNNQDLWKKIKPLSTILKYMNTGAHPDDENSGLLAYMSLGKGLESSYLVAHRGKGGQNEIGSELDDGLSIIRTREAQVASDVTNSDVIILNDGFEDSIDGFGFSKTVTETFEEWGEEKTYKRVIKNIREERPDILFASFRNIEGQHGNHRAISELTQRAFEDAGDPEVFPGQLKDGLKTWQPQKVYIPGTDSHDEKDHTTLKFNIGGEVDPVYEKTYPQLGEESRYLHKSQGMGKDLPVEDQYESLELVDSIVTSGEEDSIFEGMSYDFADYATEVDDNELTDQLKNLQNDLDKIVSLYPDKSEILEKIQKVLGNTKELTNNLKDEQYELSNSKKTDLLERLKVKSEQLQDASVEATDLDLKLKPENKELVREEKTKMSLVVKNNGDTTVPKIKINPIVPEGWDVSNVQNVDPVEPGETSTTTFDVIVGKNADYYHPYDDPIFKADISYNLMGAKIKQTITPDTEDDVFVLPNFSLETSPERIPVNTEESEKKIDVDVNVTNHIDGSNDGQVKLEVPQGWNVQPKEVNVSFSEQNEKEKVSFEVTTNKKVDSGNYSLSAKVLENDSNSEFSSIYQPIEYEHIGKTYWPKGEGKVKAEAFSLKTPKDLKVGYVDSGFDEVPDYLQQVGIDITKLSPEDVKSGNLDKYDTIAVGIRAYLNREDLTENNDRLLQYAKDGGHVVMQYHKPGDNWDTNETAPFKLEVGSPSIEWRVTDQASKVNLLKPDSPLFNYPNEIGDKDWANWIQERGLYFPMDWDDHFETYVSMSDYDDAPWNGPFESGILMADYGEGTYMYTNLGFYRQIQNLVPGAYRIFTNLLGYPLHEDKEDKVNAVNIISLIDKHKENGEFDSDTAHKLKIHMKAVKQFEKNEKGEKIIKHMKGFKILLDQQKDNQTISEKAYGHLKDEANKMIEKW